MQTKYCDHGAYTVSASFTFAASGYSSNITVSNVVGTIIPGMRFISSFYSDTYKAITGGSGTSFTSSYYNNAATVSNLTGTATGGFLTNPATWGIPIEGDGLARDPSPSAATISIDMTNAAAVAGNTFVLAGATLTCSASPAANQFAVASGSALVTALVNAINRTNNTSTIVTSGLPAGWYAHKVQDVFYARADPNNANNLQIMTRAGSALYNQNTGFSVTYSGITGLAQTSYLLDGGVSGCWGTFFNHIVAWPSAMAAGTYGVAPSSSMQPLAGSRRAGDRILCRSHNRIGGSTLYSYDGGYSSTIGPTEGTTTEALVFDFDDGTAWPSDIVNGVQPIFRLTWTGSQYNRLKLGAYGGGMIRYLGKRYANGQRNVVVETVGGISNNVTTVLGMGGPAIFDNIDLVALDLNAYPSILSDLNALTTQKTVIRGCRVLWQKQDSTRLMLNMSAATYATVLVEGYDLTFQVATSDAAQTGIASLIGYNTGETTRLFIDGLNLVGFQQGSTLQYITAGSNGNAVANAIIKNVNPGQVSNFGPSFSAWQVNSQNATYGDVGIFVSSNAQNGLLASDTPQGYWGWSILQNPPCLNARLPDGVTAWSIRIMPSTKTDNINILNPIVVNCGAKTVNTSGIKTLTANFLLESTMAWSAKDVAITVSYQDTSGVMRTEQSLVFNDTPALTATNNQWIRPNGGSAMDSTTGLATYADVGGIRSYNQYAITLTTSYPVAVNSDINWTFRVHRTTQNTLQQIFVDPDLQIVAVS